MPLTHLSWADNLRQILGLLALSAVAVVWLQATRRLRHGDTLDRLLDGFLILAWIAVMAFWGLASAGAFRLGPVVLLLSLAAAVVMLVSSPWASGDVDHTTRTRQTPRRSRLLLGAIGCPWAIIVSARLLKGLVAPPMGWDTLTYHLSRAAIWVQSGGLTLPAFPDAWSYYTWFPVGSDILLAWVLLATHNDLLVGVYGMFIWFLVLLTVRRLATLAGAQPELAWFAGLALATLPCVLSFATSGYADNPLLLFSLLAATHAIDFLRRGRPAAAGFGAAAAGLAAAVKISGILIAVAVLATLFAGIAKRRQPRRALLGVAIVLLATLPTIGYARAWAVRGSPVYPLKTPFVESMPFHQGFDLLHSGQILREHAEHPRGISSVVALFWTGGRANGHLNLGLGGLLLVLLACAGIFRGLTRAGQRDMVFVGLGLTLSTVPLLTGQGVAALRTVWLGVIGRLLIPGWAAAIVCAALLPPLIALPGLATAAVLNLVHSQPLGFSPTLSAASLTSLALLVVATLCIPGARALQQRVDSRLLAVLPILLPVLILVPGISSIRDAARLDAWRETGQGGTAFDAHALNPVFPALVPILEHLDDGKPKRLAVAAGWDGVGHNQFLYPLFGRRLEHQLLYVAVNKSGNDVDLLPEERRQRADESAWLARLESSDADFLVGLWPRPFEWDWVEAHPERFDILDLDPHGFFLLARVR
jgi:hypothetical protein